MENDNEALNDDDDDEQLNLLPDPEMEFVTAQNNFDNYIDLLWENVVLVYLFDIESNSILLNDCHKYKFYKYMMEHSCVNMPT